MNLKEKVFGYVKVHPQNNELNIGKRHLKDFIASMRGFLGIWTTDCSIRASSFKKKKKADWKYAGTNAFAALVSNLNLSRT